MSSRKKMSIAVVILEMVLIAILSVELVAAREKFKVVTTFTVIADIARNIAGDVAIVKSITKPGAEIHTYQPTPGDIQRAQGAHLILWNGLGLERWFEKFFQNMGNVPSVIVSRGIKPISISEGPYKGDPNPHAWMSPILSFIYIDNIRDAFIKYDSANAEVYQANAESYKKKIKSVIDPIREKLASVPEDQRWLVSSEGAFSYLAHDFSLRELYLWPINADQQGTPQQVRKVIDRIRKNNIAVVFSESTISPKPAEQIARETGAQYGGVLYVDSLSEADGPVPTYLDLLKVTSGTIAKKLASSSE